METLARAIERLTSAGFCATRTGLLAAGTGKTYPPESLEIEEVVPRVWELVSDAESEVPEPLRPVLAEAAREVAELERRIDEVEAQLEGLSRTSPLVRRLRTIAGVGLLTATAIVAAVRDLARFPSARHFASALGLTPREHSSGNVRRLGRITKRGDPYLRILLLVGESEHHFHSQGQGQFHSSADTLPRDAAVSLSRAARFPKAQTHPAVTMPRSAGAGLRRQNSQPLSSGPERSTDVLPSFGTRCVRSAIGAC